MGGAGLVKLVAYIKGTILYTDTLSVVVKSPDIMIEGCSKGIVDILDQAVWAPSYLSSCGDPEYYWLYDFNGDCEIDIIDLAMIARNWLHSCGQ